MPSHGARVLEFESISSSGESRANFCTGTGGLRIGRDALERHLGAAIAEPARLGLLPHRLDAMRQAAPRHGFSAITCRNGNALRARRFRETATSCTQGSIGNLRARRGSSGRNKMLDNHAGKSAWGDRKPSFVARHRLVEVCIKLAISKNRLAFALRRWWNTSDPLGRPFTPELV